MTPPPTNFGVYGFLFFLELSIYGFISNTVSPFPPLSLSLSSLSLSSFYYLSIFISLARAVIFFYFSEHFSLLQVSKRKTFFFLTLFNLFSLSFYFLLKSLCIFVISNILCHIFSDIRIVFIKVKQKLVLFCISSRTLLHKCQSVSYV